MSVVTKYAGESRYKKIVLVSLPVTNLVDAHVFVPSVMLASHLLCETLTSRCVSEVNAVPVLIR